MAWRSKTKSATRGLSSKSTVSEWKVPLENGKLDMGKWKILHVGKRVKDWKFQKMLDTGKWKIEPREMDNFTCGK